MVIVAFSVLIARKHIFFFLFSAYVKFKADRGMCHDFHSHALS